MIWAMHRIFYHFHFCTHLHFGCREQLEKILKMLKIFRFPFDCMTPRGYLLALTIEGIVCISIVLIGAPPFCFLIGSCTLLNAFSKDIANDLVNFNADTRLLKRSIKTLKSSFSRILQESADTKQLSENFCNVYFNVFKIILIHLYIA